MVICILLFNIKWQTMVKYGYIDDEMDTIKVRTIEKVVCQFLL